MLPCLNSCSCVSSLNVITLPNTTLLHLSPFPCSWWRSLTWCLLVLFVLFAATGLLDSMSAMTLMDSTSGSPSSFSSCIATLLECLLRMFLLFLFSEFIELTFFLSAASPHMAVAMIILPILITFLFLFAGVLSPPDQLPRFWEVSQSKYQLFY